MEPSTFFIDQEIKFKKADLEALKEDEESESPWYRVCNLSDLHYSIMFEPNGRFQSFRKHSVIHIFVHLGRATSVDVDAEFTIQNSPFSAHLKQTYKVNQGWVKGFCTTSELFDTENNCFTDGEMTLKIKATFKIELNRIKYPFAAQWNIKESKALRSDSIYSKSFKVSRDIKYNFSFHPNGDKAECIDKKTSMYLSLTFETCSKIEAVWTFSVDSANFVKEVQVIIVQDRSGEGFGINLCSAEELFDPEKRYFVDGELTLKINGTFMVEKEREPTILALEQGIVQKGYHRGKNFTFIVGENSIKVHKHVLISASSVFAGMFESKILKEVKEKKMEIVDFDYEIVHAAIKLLYSSSLPQTFYFEQMLDLLRFSDKYDIILIKNAVQEYLIKRISPTNVCSLINFTSIHNAPKLLSQSREYLVKRLNKKEAVHGLETINKDIMLEILLLVATKNA